MSSNRGSSNKPKGSQAATSHHQSPKKKQEPSNSSKPKSTGPIRNTPKEPSDTSKSTPKALSNKSNKASQLKSTPKKGKASTPKQKGGSVNKKDAKDESKSGKESAPKLKGLTSTLDKSPNTTPTKNKNLSTAFSSPKQSPNTTPSRSNTKRKRMTKQEKLEKEKKAEERSKIFDDWSEESEEEAEEKKQIKEIIKQKVGDDSDSGSDDEREPAFLGDDNIHGYDDDDDDEVLPPEPLKNAKNGSCQESKDKTSAIAELKVKQNDCKVSLDSSKNDVQDGTLLDIDKMLKETEVPNISIESANNKSPKKPKRGVKFSTELSKDIAIKKIQLVQTPSNLADPMELEDEFAFSEEPELAVAKPILKRPNRPPPKIIQEPVKPDEDNDIIEDGIENQDNSKTLESPTINEHKKPEQTEPTNANISSHTQQSKSIEINDSTISKNPSSEKNLVPITKSAIDKSSICPSTASSLSGVSNENRNKLTKDTKSTANAASDVDSSVMEQQSSNNYEARVDRQDILGTTEENSEAVSGTGHGTDQEETYFMLVDDNSDHVVDSLNSQILYLDSNSLANGNMVLMTQDSLNAATQQGNGATENNAVANGGMGLAIPSDGIQSLERQVVTTVDTKGGVASIPGQMQHASAASQIQLITSPAQAPGPLMSATAKPTSIQSTE